MTRCLILSGGFAFLLSGLFAQSEALPPQAEAIKTAHLARVKAEVTVPWDGKLFELNVRYVAALKREQETAQQGGRLEEALAMAAEQKQIIKQGAAPESDSEDMPATLKPLRATYRKEWLKLREDHDIRLRVVTADTVKALNELMVSLTMAGQLDDALAVKNLAEELKAAGGTPKVAGGESGKALADALAGTRWEWNGSPRYPLTFQADGRVGMENWSEKGLKTSWKVTGPETVTLEVLEGRATDLTATLVFSEGRQAYRGKDFSGKDLAPSLRID